MQIDRRLFQLESKVALLPRTGADLLREYQTTPAAQQEAWLTTLTDAEVDLLCDELALVGRAEAEAEGKPYIDFHQLTNDELLKIIEGAIPINSSVDFLIGCRTQLI